MKTILDLAFDKHSDWVRIVKSFGCNEAYAEDIVQEMYIQLHLDLNKGIDFSFGDDINHYYCFKVLRGIYLNKSKKDARALLTYLDENKTDKQEDEGINESEWQERTDNVDKVLDSLHWYDAKVFRLISTGMSISELSRKTGIGYHSLRYTYINTLKMIKHELQ